VETLASCLPCPLHAAALVTGTQTRGAAPAVASCCPCPACQKGGPQAQHPYGPYHLRPCRPPLACARGAAAHAPLGTVSVTVASPARRGPCNPCCRHAHAPAHPWAHHQVLPCPCPCPCLQQVSCSAACLHHGRSGARRACACCRPQEVTPCAAPGHQGMATGPYRCVLGAPAAFHCPYRPCQPACQARGGDRPSRPSHLCRQATCQSRGVLLALLPCRCTGGCCCGACRLWPGRAWARLAVGSGRPCKMHAHVTGQGAKCAREQASQDTSLMTGMFRDRDPERQ
jgi:hypothetical protein